MRAGKRWWAFWSLLGLLPLGGTVQASLFHHGEKPVWQEDFRSKDAKPDPAVWQYAEGGGGDGWGNGELETYCAYGSKKAPCDPARRNAFVATDGNLHIVARKTADGHYTSARLLSLGLKEFKYGRIEARIRIPAGRGLWPAFWMLGSDSEVHHWPACGEIDVMENIGSKEPGTIHGTIHGVGFRTLGLGKPTMLPNGAPFSAAFHNYGVIWKLGSVAFYVDDPKKPYAVYTPKDLPAGAVWPFDSRSFYLLLNLAVGGGWPGPPDADTHFPAEMLVKSIKVWQEK